MNLHGKNLLGDQLSGGPETFTIASPLDGQPLTGEFHVATSSDVDTALRLADEAFAAFRDSAAAQRATLLETIADEIVALGDALIDRAHRETGLPVARLTGER